jgi:fructose-1,6-bisphosphatase/inositol monophosphatase family enzyme
VDISQLISGRTQFKESSFTILTTVSAASDNLMDKVGKILQEVSEEAIEPRFEALQEADVRFKSPGELVILADEEAERQLKTRLGELIPEALFVGEEGFSGGSGLEEALRSEQIWLVDPLDGTANFVSGSPR